MDVLSRSASVWRWLAIWPGLTCTVLGLAACNRAAGDAPPAAPPAPPVQAAVVIERPVDETQEFSGRLEAIDRVDIRARVGGFITSVNFTPGGVVKKGDVLFVIDTRPFQAEANRTEAEVRSIRARADLARVELARAEKLIADRAIAQRELDQSTANLRQLDADAKAAQAAFEAARLNLAYTRVIAPIAGRVSKAEITVGNLVDTTVILTSIVSSKPIYASFDGDESTYLRVARAAQQGAPVMVRVGLANEAGFPHQGKLEFVDNRLDAATGSVRMRAIFTNESNLLVPGLFARVQLAGDPGAKKPAALIVDQAISTDQDRKFVYVVKADNTVEYRAIVPGPLADGLRVVRSGIKPGEKIVVSGLQRVRPGAPVAPQLVPMAPPAEQGGGGHVVAAGAAP
jgi:multidrug efflux system membrane fusion protein